MDAVDDFNDHTQIQPQPGPITLYVPLGEPMTLRNIRIVDHAQREQALRFITQISWLPTVVRSGEEVMVLQARLKRFYVDAKNEVVEYDQDVLITEIKETRYRI